MSAATTNPANEAFGQARQGSVAAIIQVLNEHLSDAGIRTRAVVADGILQILCEATSPEQLDKQTVVSRVRQILENISPQRISRVNINSRIVKEEQLLWLEEINRDPENALLWSEMITLKRPFFLKRWIRDRNLKPAGPIFRDITEPAPNKGSLSSKIIGGAGLTLLVLATGWILREEIGQFRQGDTPSTTAPQDTTDVPSAPEQGAAPSETPEAPASSSASSSASSGEGDGNGERTADTTPQTPPPNAPAASNPTPAATDTPPISSGNVTDAFAEAVRIANQASTDGLSASTATEWLDLATRWQRAADLMAQIPAGNEQYAAAQERVVSYGNNSQAALAEAAALTPD